MSATETTVTTIDALLAGGVIARGSGTSPLELHLAINALRITGGSLAAGAGFPTEQDGSSRGLCVGFRTLRHVVSRRMISHWRLS
jgi:hypothetical protein